MVTTLGDSKIFQLGESNLKILRGGVTKIQLGEWDFFCKIKFSGRGVKIFQVGESNPIILTGGVNKIQVGEWDLFLQSKIFQVGE